MNNALSRRITFVNRYFYPDHSATAQMLYDLTQRLVAEGFEVGVICSRQLYQDSKAGLLPEENIKGVKVYRVKTTSFGRNGLVGRAIDYASFYFSAGLKLFQITRSGDVLVAKTDPPLVSVVVGMVAFLRRAKLVNWLQDLFPEVAVHIGAGLPRWMVSPLLYVRNLTLRMAAANVVIGLIMKERLLKLGVDAKKVHVIENWADGDSIYPKPSSDSQLRAKLGLQQKFVVSYSGNLGRAHEYETFLNAAIALQNDIRLVFLIIGGGAKYTELVEQVRLNRLDNFVFIPYQSRNELSDSLAAGDIHLISLLPNLEGYIVPSKFYGILAAGRPAIVIGDSQGELARIVTNEHCGQSVQLGDSNSLVGAIRKLVENGDLLTDLGRSARDLYDKKYTVTYAAERWSALVTRL